MTTCNIEDDSGEQCGYNASSLRDLKKHYRQEHGGEVETPEEELPDLDHEQRDFEGEEPSDEDHDPEYEVTNDVPETEETGLDWYS